LGMIDLLGWSCKRALYRLVLQKGSILDKLHKSLYKKLHNL